MIKIISWNITDLAAPKLGNNFDLDESNGAGFGNNVGSYILSVAMGHVNWANLQWLDPAEPVDLFVIIEPVCAAGAKGNAANGSGVLAMTDLRNAMNMISNSRHMLATHTYATAPPLITGTNEFVAIIYNAQKLTYVNSTVLRKANNTNLLPRGPFFAQFTTIPGGGILNVTGVHAPPPAGAAADRRFKPPIDYNDDLAALPWIAVPPPAPPAAAPVSLVAGDFNSCPNDFYNVAVPPYNRVDAFLPLLANYSTNLPNGTLSSMRTAANATSTVYKLNAYDNIFFRNYNPANVQQAILDLIAWNPRYRANGAATSLATMQSIVGNYWMVSDHLPACMKLN